MRIGLIDVDGHNKKTRWGSAFPNLALMKISAWHKLQGDEVEWAQPYVHYNVLYQSKIFRSSPDVEGYYYADVVKKGGTGNSLTEVLPDDIDRMQPDYSIYPWIKSREAYGFLTRGCPNKCKWCIVPKKEGEIRPYMDVDEIAQHGKRPYLTLMDNNILAAGDYAVEQLEKIIRGGYHVDFNQAMDARLITPQYARLLSRVKWFPYIRFGCDTHAQIAHCERALALLHENGWRGKVFLYCMITSDFDESIARVNYWRDKLVAGEKTYPHVQPYLDFNDPSWNPPKWQQDMARWSGIISLKKTFPIMDYVPRNVFVFSMYRDYPILQQCKTKEEITAMMQRYNIPAAPVRPLVKKSEKTGCHQTNTTTSAQQLMLELDW